MPKMTPMLALASLLAATLGAPDRALADEAGEAAIRDSVVKVYATMRAPDPLRPWAKASPREGSGTGVVIEGNRILTNAHVVLYASQVFVQPHQSGQKVSVTVESIAPGIDLAVLKLDDEAFFEKRPPLKRVPELPEVKDSVLVYGYPTGGDSLSVTKGIVSRIEFTGYNNQTTGLRIQVDAAINPGNSGGPALVDDAMIGLAFSRLGSGDNIGYIIPTEEVELFLKDVADGKYDGKPAFFDSYQTLENPALRAKLNLPAGTEGMVVKDAAEDVGSTLKTWDVVTKIGDKEIDSVGKVQAANGLRLDFRYAVQTLAKDGKIPVSVVRDGKPMELELPVQPRRPQLIEGLENTYPSYFVWGPMVFSPVYAELVNSLERQNGIVAFMAAIGSPLATRRGDRPKFPGEELVMVPAPLFPHKVSKGYSNPQTKVVKKVDDIPVKNLKHLVEILRDGTSEFVTIEFDDRSSEILVFNRKEVAGATEDILSDNGVRRQSSDDIAPLWSKKAD